MEGFPLHGLNIYWHLFTVFLFLSSAEKDEHRDICFQLSCTCLLGYMLFLKQKHIYNILSLSASFPEDRYL